MQTTGHYLSELDLNQEPFSTSPDPAFFYKSAGHISALNKLEIAVRLKRGMSLVLGDVGTGKTTLCRTLIQSFEEEADTFEFHMILDPFFKTDNHFYATLTRILGLSPFFRSDVDYRDAIKEYLLRKNTEEHKTIVLVIDEGQKLKPEHLEILRTLLNYETNEQKLLQLVIFAQLELLPRLRVVRNFMDRITLKKMLSPLDQYETSQMIEFRLRTAGYSGSASLFTADALQRVYEHTKGYPRQILKICHDSLELLIMQDQRLVNEEIIEQVIKQDRVWDNS